MAMQLLFSISYKNKDFIKCVTCEEYNCYLILLKMYLVYWNYKTQSILLFQGNLELKSQHMPQCMWLISKYSR